MASVRELLQFVIDGDARGLVRTFDDVDKASTKTLGKAESGWQKFGAGMQKAGAIGLGVSAVLGVGMFKAAQAAGQLELSMSRLKGIFGASVGDVEDFVDTANKFGLSNRAASQAAASIGEAAVQLGLSKSQAAKLTPELIGIVTQLGILNKMDTGAALETVNAAMRGEYDSLQRLVPSISNATIVQKAMRDEHVATESALTQEQKTRAALSLIITDGTKTLERSEGVMESLAGQTAIMQANLDDAFTSIGTGALTVIEPAVSLIGDLANKFNELSPATRAAFGEIAAIGTVGLGGLSALALVGGTAISTFLRLRDSITALNETMPRLANNITIAGRALAALGIAAAILGVVQALSAMEDAKQKARIDDIISANAVDKVKEFDKAVAAVVKRKSPKGGIVQAIFGDNVPEMLDFVGDLNEEVKVSKDVFQDLIETQGTGVAAGRELIKQMQDQGIATGDYEKALDKQIEAELKARRQTEETAAALTQKQKAQDKAIAAEDSAAGKAKRAEMREEDHAKAVKATADAFDAGAKALENYNAVLDLGATRGAAFADAMERTTRIDEQLEGGLALGEAVGTFKETIKDLPDTIDQAKLALGGYSEEQTAAIDALVKLSDETTNYLDVLFASNKTVPEVRAGAALLAAEYTKQFEAAGKSKEEIDAYLEVLGLTPPQVETAIILSGQAEAQAKLVIMQQTLSNIHDTETIARINTLIAKGDFVGAVNEVNAYYAAHPAKLPVVPVWEGGTFKPPGYPQIYRPRAATAMNRTAATSRTAGLSAGTYAGPGSALPMLGSSIVINMPAGADGPSVVRALRRYEQRNGTTNHGWRPT